MTKFGDGLKPLWVCFPSLLLARAWGGQSPKGTASSISLTPFPGLTWATSPTPSSLHTALPVTSLLTFPPSSLPPHRMHCSPVYSHLAEAGFLPRTVGCQSSTFFSLYCPCRFPCPSVQGAQLPILALPGDPLSSDPGMLTRLNQLHCPVTSQVCGRHGAARSSALAVGELGHWPQKGMGNQLEQEAAERQAVRKEVQLRTRTRCGDSGLWPTHPGMS